MKNATAATPITPKPTAAPEQNSAAAEQTSQHTRSLIRGAGHAALKSSACEFIAEKGSDSRLLERIIDLRPESRKYIHAALDCVEGHADCEQPSENFVQAVLLYFADGQLTPNDAFQMAEEFQDSFGMGLRAARRMLRLHPELISEEETAD